MPDSPSCNVTLFVCQTCRRADIAQQDVPAGAQLLDHLVKADLPAGVTVTGVSCLSNCKNGCTIILQDPARWSYIYANINPESDLEQLCTGIAGYIDSDDGIVPWSQRVTLFKKNSIARIPPTARMG